MSGCGDNGNLSGSTSKLIWSPSLPTNARLVELGGSISNSTLPNNTLPTGTWSVTNTFYKVPAASCGSSFVPTSAELLYTSANNSASGLTATQEVVSYVPTSTYDFTAGDCMLLVVSPSTNGAVNAETQIHGIFRTLPGSEPNEASEVRAIGLLATLGTPVKLTR